MAFQEGESCLIDIGDFVLLSQPECGRDDMEGRDGESASG